MTYTRIILHLLLLTIGVYSLSVDYLEKDDPSEGLYKINYINEIADLEQSEILNPKNKKSSPRCTVKKILMKHPDDGFHYYPTHYQEYECVPVQENIFDTDYADQETCLARSCQSVHSEHLYLKKKIGQKCWQMDKIKINAGCKCILP